MTAAIAIERDVVNGRSECAMSPYLAYHEITEVEPAYLYSISVNRFREHAGRLQQLVRESCLATTSHHITFDDGHISQYVQALPVLEDLSLKAIFFITAGWTEKRPGYMLWKQLEDLRRCGHEVQSHGWSHVLLTQCSAKELEAELARSKRELEDHLGAGVNAISMPGGRCNKRVLEACRQAGYERVFTSDPWTKHEGRVDLQIAGRWMVTRDMSAQRIHSLLEGKGAAMYLLRARHFSKNAAKLVLGDSNYQSLWRILASKGKSQEDASKSSESGKRTQA